MTFFKKKRFSEVEGYERISKMLGDRQRELGGDDSLDDLDEDSVILTPGARPSVNGPADVTPMRRPTEGYGGSPEATSRPEQRFEAFSQPPAPMPPIPPLSQVAPTVAIPTPQAAPRMTQAEAPASFGGTVISKDAVWEGKLTSSGDIRVEGRLQGEIETSGTLHVIASARVQGTVHARNVIIAGEIEGQLRCDGKLEIQPGGSARGEIDTGALVVHEGAFIESKFQMRREGVGQRG